MPHENKLIVQYVIKQGNSVSTQTDEYVWNAHRFCHELDHHDNLVITKSEYPPSVVDHHRMHIKTYAKGTWITVELDYDEHDV